MAYRHDYTERQPIVDSTEVDIRHPYDEHDVREYPSNWAIFCVVCLSLVMILMYNISIYCSFYVDDIMFSMWLAVNGLVGTYLVLNAVTHWLALNWQESCRLYVFFTRMIHIIGTVFMTFWTIMGWNYFANHFTQPAISFSFYTFMWFYLISQTILMILSCIISYLFCKFFFERSNDRGRDRGNV
jgi:hypothetical protein